MSSPAISFWLIAILAAFSAPQLLAENTEARADVLDMSLEQLMQVDIDSVLGASGFKQSVTDAPASITIVTADEIRRYGYRTLADILRSVPGFYVTSDRDTSYIGVRGFGPPGDYNSRILLLIDGHRLVDSIHGAAVYSTDFPVDTDLIDRVEVIRGPNSSVYIASALLGVINVVTKSARKEALSLSGQFGSYKSYRTRLGFGRRFDSGLEVLLSGSYYDNPGPPGLYFREFDSALTSNGVARNADGAQSYQQFAKISYRGFTFEGVFGSSQQQDPTASYGTIFNDPQEEVRMKAGFADLSYEHRFGRDWGYVAHVFYDDDRYRGIFPVDESPFGGASHVLNQDLSSGLDVGASFALSKRLPLNQTLIVGTEYRDNFRQNQLNYDAEPYQEYFKSIESSTLWGAHIQDQLPIRNNLILDLGLSFDHYSTFGGTTNPRAAFIYQPYEETTFKFMYGQSFRAPNGYELYNAGIGQMPNPNLQPEKAKTMELVWEQSVPKDFQLVTSGYYYPIRAGISAQTEPTSGLILYQNGRRIDLRGAEIALKRQSRSGWEAGLSMSFQAAKNLSSPSPLSNSPRVLTQTALSVPLFRGKLFASMGLQYVSHRWTVQGDRAAGYVVPNFTVYSPGAWGGCELSASIYNAFDKLYGDPASIAHASHILYSDGRNFRLTFTRRF